MKRILLQICSILFFTSVALAERNIYTGETTAAERGVPVRLVDATDNETEETGITISGAECRVCKNGVTASCANCAGTWLEAENGIYEYRATAGEIDTLGSITVRINDTAANVFVGTANIVAYDPTDSQWTVDVAASGIPYNAYAARGTAQSVDATHIQLASAEALGDDIPNGGVAVMITSATLGTGQVRCIRDYVSSTDTALVDTWTVTPTGTITYDLIPAPDCTINDTTLASSAGTEIATAVGAVGVTVAAGGITNSSLADGAISAGKIASAAFTNAKFGSGAITGDTIADSSLTSAKFGANFITEAGIADDAITAAQLSSTAVDEIATGVSVGGGAKTAQSATTLEVVLAASETYGANTLANHNSIWIESATLGKGQVRCIKSNTNTTSANKVVLSEAFRIQPTGTIQYRIIQTPNCNKETWFR